MKYIKLSKNKIPKHNLKTFFDYNEIKSESNVGLLMEPPYVVFDFDDPNEWFIVKELLIANNLKTKMMETDKGGHLWFKSEKPLKNNINILTPIGLKIDIRSWGKKSFVMIKKNNQWRKWINEDIEPIEIPFFLKPLPHIKKVVDFVGLRDGDGRNTKLFSWIIPLLKSGFSKQQIYQIFLMINEAVFVDPLSDNELENMIDKNNIFESYARDQAYENPLAHNVFGNALVEEFDLKAKFDQVYIFLSGQYENDERLIERLMIEKNETIKSGERLEILKYLRLLEPVKEDIDNAKKYINLKNGLLNIETWELEPHDASIFDMNQINIIYDKTITDDWSEQLFKDWSNNDIEMQHLLEEIAGYAFVKDLSMQKAVLALGWGENGKSTFFELITAMAGFKNVSSVSLEDLNANYNAAEFAGKLVNIGGDISTGQLHESAIFKKLAVGEPFVVRRIYGHPFELKSNALMLFAANSFPSIQDRTDGFFRRWLIPSFDNKVGVGQSLNQKLEFKQKLLSSRNLTACFNIAMRGLKRLQNQGSFTEPQKSKQLLEKFRQDNNNVLQWLKEINQIRVLNDVNVNDAYTQYCEATKMKNLKPFSIINFKDYIIKLSKYNAKVIYIENEGYFFKLERNK